MIRNNLWLLGGFILVMACNSAPESDDFDWQGHRGARGEAPENTVPAMRKALQQGVKTLEMDVVITADSVVVLSHEPFFNEEICLNPAGEPIDSPRSYNIFKMTAAELEQFDCGSKGHPDFLGQERFPATKPSLLEVLATGEESVLTMNRTEPYYNIEIKSRPAWDGQYHPEVATYVDLVVDDIKLAKVADRTIIQSFDLRALRYAHENYPELTLALLNESEEKSFAEVVSDLGFVPDIYSPHYSLVSSSLVRDLQAQGVRIIPWTVNEIKEAEGLRALGVDGIITDYPGRMLPAFGPERDAIN